MTLAHDWIHTTYNGHACSQTSSYGTQNIGIGNGSGFTLIDDDIDCFGDNTLVNPEPQTTDLFGGEQLGTLANITVEGNLVAGNQANGGINMGCTAGNGFKADFGRYSNKSILVQDNRFSNIYNVNSPGGGFLAGNTDGGSGTTWTGNYMDNDLSTVAQPVYGC